MHFNICQQLAEDCGQWRGFGGFLVLFLCVAIEKQKVELQRLQRNLMLTEAAAADFQRPWLISSEFHAANSRRLNMELGAQVCVRRKRT